MFLCHQESAALWEGRLSHRKQDEESEARRFNSLVLAGRLRSAVRNLTAREGGVVRAAGDVCTKTGENIVSVLQAKFPPLREANIGSEDCLAFEEYPRAPDPLDLIVGGDDVEKVAGKLSGAAGIDCVDAADAQGCCHEEGDIRSQRLKTRAEIPLLNITKLIRKGMLLGHLT